MKKYYIGIIVIVLFTLGAFVLTIAQGSAQKQDKTTYKKAQEIAKDLNEYIRNNRKLPESLEEAGITDAPSSISYTKESNTEFKFCETYKSESSYGGAGISSLLYGAALSSYEDRDYDDYSSDYKPSSLYISYSHKKGENCQTVKPYILETYRSTFNTTPTIRNTTPSTSTSRLARDTERQTDIKALHGQIEAYYAQNGYYPTLANMNSASFRASNLRGLDVEALADPVGKNQLLVSAPRANSYSYAVTSATGAACNNTTSDCAQYTLTATLESGGTYTKENLN